MLGLGRSRANRGPGWPAVCTLASLPPAGEHEIGIGLRLVAGETPVAAICGVEGPSNRFRCDTMQVMTTSHLLELLDRIGLLLRTEKRRLGTAFALQPVHLQVLEYLQRCNRYSNTPAALGAYLGQTKGTVSQSLKLLEREGYLEKKDDLADRRVVRLQLTTKGRTRLRDLEPTQDWERAEAALSAAQRKVVTQALEQLLRALQQARGGRAFGVCRTCRHFQSGSDRGHHCGLTGEPLSEDDSRRICYEHEWRQSA